MTSTPTTGRGTYQVRTFGCQMNVHDSERLAGLLETAGYTPAPESADVERGDVDVIVFNTCAVRENADRRLYGHLGMLRPAKRRNPNLQIAVGGCLAQKDRSTITDRAPWVDVVFGTHNIHSLPVLLDRARHERDAQVEILESLEVFPSTLPTKRESAAAGWVSISVGCNNTCTFCIVPSLRGKEKDRRPGDILAEVQHLVDTGAIEVTLLGQNVNSYGVEFGDRGAFAKLLRACGEIDGLERIRFTSPHPAMFTDDVIDAMAETPTVMPQLHMPLQSGSDRILKAMRRSYRSAKFLRILDSVRERIPHAAITTDIIVGFPGETEDDFQRTLDVVEASRFSRDQQTHRLSGRSRDNRLVHVGIPAGLSEADMPRPGDAVTARVTAAAPFYLVADSGVTPADAGHASAPTGASSGEPAGEFRIRRTRSGDAWQARLTAADDSCSTGGCGTGPAPAGPVGLGMPSVRAPQQGREQGVK